MEILKSFQVRGAPGAVRRTVINGRTIDFWAPPEPTPYLLITHDGQNIFDSATATRGRTWELGKAVNRVATELGVPAPVVIAVFHSSTPQDPYGRAKDLAPQDLFQGGVEPVLGHSGIWPTPTPSFPLSELRGNRYLEEIVRTVAPEICEFLGHSVEPAKSAILGASMGGLAALNGLARYPDFFQSALAFSPHWCCGLDPLVRGLMQTLPPPGEHKIWMSRGTKSHDAHYGPYQELANNLALSAGYRYGRDLTTPIFNRTTHNERSWSRYLNQALRFWLAG
jgi:predicted alpha/beta superfamily hydrolase